MQLGSRAEEVVKLLRAQSTKPPVRAIIGDISIHKTTFSFDVILASLMIHALSFWIMMMEVLTYKA
jgi:hypothetical protein